MAFRMYAVWPGGFKAYRLPKQPKPRQQIHRVQVQLRSQDMISIWKIIMGLTLISVNIALNIFLTTAHSTPDLHCELIPAMEIMSCDICRCTRVQTIPVSESGKEYRAWLGYGSRAVAHGQPLQKYGNKPGPMRFTYIYESKAYDITSQLGARVLQPWDAVLNGCVVSMI